MTRIDWRTALTITLLATGCTRTPYLPDDDDDLTSPSPTEAAEEQGEDHPLAPGSEEDPYAELTVVNESSWPVVELYLSPCDAEDWGPDQLGGDLLDSGWMVTFTELPEGCYDLLAFAIEDAGYWEVYGLEVVEAETFTLTD